MMPVENQTWVKFRKRWSNIIMIMENILPIQQRIKLPELLGEVHGAPIFKRFLLIRHLPKNMCTLRIVRNRRTGYIQVLIIKKIRNYAEQEELFVLMLPVLPDHPAEQVPSAITA